MSLSLVLDIVALICLIVAALQVPTARVSIGWMGMALWLLAALIGGGVIIR